MIIIFKVLTHVITPANFVTPSAIPPPHGHRSHDPYLPERINRTA